jgi:hypothetical protein
MELLLDRSSCLAYLKGMLSQLLGDTGHVVRTPCEDVGVVPKETVESEFLFGVEVGPIGDFHGRVGQANAISS